MPKMHQSLDKHYVEIFLVTLFGDYSNLLAKRIEERKKKYAAKLFYIADN